MSAGPDERELQQAAEDAARRAGRILADKFGGERTIEYKGGIDLVTDADKASEAEILAFLRSRYPEHAVLAEESGVTRGTGYRWIIDPLDGTTNYSHAVPHFCISIAVENESGILAGVVYDPLRDEMFSARRGGGATLNAKTIRCADTPALEQALLCTGFPYDVREKPDAPLGLFNRLMRHAQGIRRTGSAALDLAYVAAGRFDAFFEFGLKPWDVAGGALLIWEAGGMMTRIDGEPFELALGDVLASSKRIYERLRTETGAFLADIKWTPRR